MLKYVCLIFIVMFKLSAYELGVVAIFKDSALYLKEWIEYHKMVGVDHFWLYNNESTDGWREILDPYIQEGVVEVFFAPSYVNTWSSEQLKSAEHGSWVPAQLQAYKDGINKAKETDTKWVGLIDSDEFILPMEDATVVESLNKHFQNADGVYTCWRCFGTSNIYLNKYENLIPRLTMCSSRTHPYNGVGKSIVRPNSVKIDEIWHVHHFPMVDGSVYRYSDGLYIPKKYTQKSDLQLDGKTHDKYLRINHYILRDENYFWNVRIPREDIRKVGSIDRKHYKDFSKEKDLKIHDFIKKFHPNIYSLFFN